MTNSRNLYLNPEDLYRLGNARSPRIDVVRVPKDITAIDQTGILMVRAGNKGISLFNKKDIKRVQLGGWVWEIKKGTRLPAGLMYINDHGGHYCIAPTRSMRLSEYKSLLSTLTSKCQRLYKK